MERRRALIEIQRRFPESGWRFIVRRRRFMEIPGGFMETDAASPETPWRFIETRRAEITNPPGCFQKPRRCIPSTAAAFPETAGSEPIYRRRVIE